MLKSRMSLSWQRRYVEQNDDKEKSHYFDVWSFWAVDNISPRMSLVLRISQTNIPIFPVFHAHRRTSSCEIHGKLAILALALTGKVTKMSFVLPSDVTVAARRFTQFQNSFSFIYFAELFPYFTQVFHINFQLYFSLVSGFHLSLFLMSISSVAGFAFLNVGNCSHGADKSNLRNSCANSSGSHTTRFFSSS